MSSEVTTGTGSAGFRIGRIFVGYIAPSQWQSIGIAVELGAGVWPTVQTRTAASDAISIDARSTDLM